MRITLGSVIIWHGHAAQRLLKQDFDDGKCSENDDNYVNPVDLYESCDEYKEFLWLVFLKHISQEK